MVPLSILPATAQSPFKIEIKYDIPKEGIIQYTYFNGSRQYRDSVTANNGIFIIYGELIEPSVISLRYINRKEVESFETFRLEQYKLLLDRGNVIIKVKKNLKDATITGADLQPKFIEYSTKINELYRQMQPLNAIKQKYEHSLQLDSAKISANLLEELYLSEARLLKQVIKENRKSPISLLALNDYNRSYIDPKILKKLYLSLSPKLRNMTMGKTVNKKIEEQLLYRIGAFLENFYLPDTAGNQILTKASKGEYLLLDFWASWCAPCRQEHPILKQAYNEYKDKGLRIISISLDNDREKWLKAIKEDNVTEWQHLSDLKGANTEIAKALNIKTIPFNILISEEGKIIAKNLRGFELFEVFKKYLK
jgi:thiol-disulfide isomerase/thioredoxin